MDYPKSVPSAGLVNGKFVDENPLTGTPGSLIPADWGNGVTQEIVNVIKAGDLTPDETKYASVAASNSEVSAKGWNLDSALPIASLPPATVATADGRLAVTPAAVATKGGRVSIPAGVFVGIGQEVISGQLETLYIHDPSLEQCRSAAQFGILLRAQVVAGVLTFYMQQGTLYDPACFLERHGRQCGRRRVQSTSLDMCIALVCGAPAMCH